MNTLLLVRKDSLAQTLLATEDDAPLAHPRLGHMLSLQ